MKHFTELNTDAAPCPVQLTVLVSAPDTPHIQPTHQPADLPPTYLTSLPPLYSHYALVKSGLQGFVKGQALQADRVAQVQSQHIHTADGMTF